MASTRASISKVSKRPKINIIPPKQLFVDLTQDDTKTPSPKLPISSPSAPNAPSKTPSTKDTSSSSIDYIPKSPTSSTSLSPNGYLNPPTSPPPRVSPPPPTQENASMDITLTLSPITPLDVQFDTPSPSSPIIEHPIPWNLLEAHGRENVIVQKMIWGGDEWKYSRSYEKVEGWEKEGRIGGRRRGGGKKGGGGGKGGMGEFGGGGRWSYKRGEWCGLMKILGEWKRKRRREGGKNKEGKVGWEENWLEREEEGVEKGGKGRGERMGRKGEKTVEKEMERRDEREGGEGWDGVEEEEKTETPFLPSIIMEGWGGENGGVRKGGSEKSRGNPHQKEYKEKGVIDSGRISGKGKIKTGTLDFDNVYFCKELKYNLFSVSQICDKKNNVLFTDTECLVLSSDFKLLDESQVLLRVPRKDNIYSVDLKSVVPTKGLTCLFAKATIDESKLWHRRLGHINFKNMNKLVRGNLVRGLPSKIFENDHSCVACQKGKQHKASCKTKLVNSISKPLHMLHMDLFGPTNVKSLMKKSYCLVVTDDFSRFSWVFFLATKDETSGILKTFITEIENQLDHKVKVIRCDNGTEFKNSNGVAKRRNRTLIEAARTMLVDSKLPTTFWAEAVNTACYVLNRVLVIKPHNKTPYELIRGRTPLIYFMKPFRCLVTILNIKDHLGKFDGKADDGFFLGNQTNGIAGTKDNIITGQAKKKTEPEHEYILIPFCTTDPLISQGPKDSEEDSRMKSTELNVSGASDKDGENDQATRINDARTSEEHLFEQFSLFKNTFTLPDVLNVFLTDDTKVVKGSGDTKAVNTGGEGVSTASVPKIVSTAVLRTPPTTKTFFNDKDVTMAMAQTLIKMKEEKSKEKGVAIKDVEDSSRPIRSINILQPLPTIDPIDKGDAEVALRLQAELDEELRVERERQEKASKVAIGGMFEEVQARIDADYELAARMP
ncbi:putative ribonuclease H-like domain-containing protein [Tanacetum coccineum]